MSCPMLAGADCATAVENEKHKPSSIANTVFFTMTSDLPLFILCDPAQVSDPFEIHLNLFPHVPDDFPTKLSQLQVDLQYRQVLVAVLQPVFPPAENVLADLRLESREQPYTQVERVF